MQASASASKKEGSFRKGNGRKLYYENWIRRNERTAFLGMGRQFFSVYLFPHYGYRSFTCDPDNAFRPPSFWAGVRISCEKDGKQQYDTERRIYLLLWHLTGFSVMVMDSLLAFRMTFWHEWHFTGRQKAVEIPAGIYRPLASKIKKLKIMKIKLS